MKKLNLFIVGLSLIPFPVIANTNYENQFQNTQSIKYNCADMSYGESTNCYSGIEKGLVGLANSIKGKPTDKTKINEWNKALGSVNNAYNLCVKISSINSALSGASGLSVGASCKADLMALTPYKASQIFLKK